MTDKYKDILDALDVLIEDLTPEQRNKLNQAAQLVKDPKNMNPNEAVKFVNALGIDIDKLQKKARKQKKEENIKYDRNKLCPCGSNKKYKKCCFLENN